MPDGTLLHTRILLPRTARERGPVPVVIIRNAYPIALLYEGQCDLLTRYGIGCVVQDVRGRGKSEGQWEPFVHEIDDGKSTLTWVINQPWAGDIALMGMSYLGATALATASGGLPPQVKTLVVSHFATDLALVLGERGALHHEVATTWTAFMPGQRSPNDAGARYRSMLEARPHIDATRRAFSTELPWYRSWLLSVDESVVGRKNDAQPDDPQRRVRRSFASLPAQITVPVLLVGGFDDPFFQAQLSLWDQLASKERSLFVVQPTNHLGLQAGEVRAVDVPRGMPPARFLVPWLQSHLQGAEPSLPVDAVHVRARHDAEARVLSRWPPPTEAYRLTLATGEVSGLPCSSHRLNAPDEGGPPGTAMFRYDPQRPWRVAGSARGIAFAIPGMNGLPAGPVALPWPCDRDDVVRLAGAALKSDLRIAGFATVELTVSSSAPDSAFVVKLVDIAPDGVAVHVSDGIATLQRPRHDVEQTYVPHTETRLTLELYPNEWVFHAGHRVGLWISSSVFPTFSIHPNTSRPWYLETTTEVATQRIEFEATESQLILPRVTAGSP
ncbi:MAG: CocE/NonD family hydrolase [Myxococcota bacterium]